MESWDADASEYLNMTACDRRANFSHDRKSLPSSRIHELIAARVASGSAIAAGTRPSTRPAKVRFYLPRMLVFGRAPAQLRSPVWRYL